jgi:type IV secretory pathway TraG/TraD family ATPase VirD4
VDEILKNRGKRLSTLARAIAFQLIPERLHETGDGKFFRGGARRLIIAGLLYLAAFDPKHCTLPRLRTLIWSTSEEKRTIASEMQGVDWFGGLLRDYGNALAEMLEPQYIKTYGAFRDNAMEALEIYEAGSDLGEAVSESDFSLEDILDGRTTVYLVLPESEIETHGSWMGLITTLIFETIAASRNPSPILMLLEEMGNLGRIPNITKALSLLPAKGVRCLMVFQSRRQPVELYGPNIAAIIEEQSSCVQAWAIRSEQDRKAWSARIGTTTKKARSLSRDPHDQAAPWRLSVSERAAPVLSPDEIDRLPRSRQLIALDGQSVILASKVPYYTVDAWRKAAARSAHALGAQDNSGETA